MHEPQKPKTLEDYHQREDSSSAWETKDDVRGPRRDVITRAADEALALLGDQEALRRRHADDEFRKGNPPPSEDAPTETSRGSNIKSGETPAGA